MTAREFLEGCTDREIIGYWNTFCGIANYGDDMVFPMYEFKELVGSVYGKLHKKFDFDHEYFWWDGLGYINSGYECDVIDSIVDFDMLADSIDENPSMYGIYLDD